MNHARSSVSLRPVTSAGAPTPIANPIPRFYRNRYSEAVGSGAPTMKIGIHAPSKPAVVVSLLLAILALIGYFVDSSFAFFIAMFAYIVGALGVLVEI